MLVFIGVGFGSVMAAVVCYELAGGFQQYAPSSPKVVMPRPFLHMSIKLVCCCCVAACSNEWRSVLMC